MAHDADLEGHEEGSLLLPLKHLVLLRVHARLLRLPLQLDVPLYLLQHFLHIPLIVDVLERLHCPLSVSPGYPLVRGVHSYHCQDGRLGECQNDSY